MSKKVREAYERGYLNGKSDGAGHHADVFWQGYLEALLDIENSLNVMILIDSAAASSEYLYGAKDALARVERHRNWLEGQEHGQP